MTLPGLINDLQKISSLEAISPWKALVDRSHQWIGEAFGKEQIYTLVTGRAAFVDALLVRAWELAGLHNESQVTLCAVGGYGRGHLQPHSDIDLLVVSKKSLSKEAREQISSFITFLWDIRLDVGQSVRTIKECISQSKEDITIATNLLELRYLSGSNGIFDTLWNAVHHKNRWSSKAFFTGKMQEQKNRHHKFHGTAYNLEPNIKENPGCLRDIQTIAWVAKQHFREYDGKSLVGHGYITEAEHEELVDCRMHLWKIRCALHLVAGRSENRLLFDYQPDVAKLLEYQQGENSAVEMMMRDFFRIISRVSELNTMLLQRFEADILPGSRSAVLAIGDAFSVTGNTVTPTVEDAFKQPVDVLKFLERLADNPMITALSTDCIRQLRKARRSFRPRYYCELEDCRKQFLRLMQHPNFFNYAWDVMHSHKILQRYLPAWDGIVGLMQFDLFHAYTVDEHTHRLIKHVNAYREPDNNRFPRCSRIVRNLDKPEVLFIAAILHDIAKGRGGDHSVLGAEDAYDFCLMHGLAEDETNMVVWLVRNHLLMSAVAQRRDIYDPDVIFEFASAVKSNQHLDLLYALTLADIRATNDTLWNDWKESLLRELYILTRSALDNGLECKTTLLRRVNDHKRKTYEILRQKHISLSAAEQLWNRFNDDYFSRFRPAQLAWHTEQILAFDSCESNALLVTANDDVATGGTEFLIYGKDRPALFAQVASVLDSKNCSIRDAHITITQDNYVFDSLLVLENDGSRLNSSDRIAALEKAIIDQIQRPGRTHENRRRISRQLRQLEVPVQVTFMQLSQETTQVELHALDVPGLLAKIGHAFVDCNTILKLAKIATIGERAEDVFIVSNAEGKQLTASQQVALEQRLKEKIEQLEHTSN